MKSLCKISWNLPIEILSQRKCHFKRFYRRFSKVMNCWEGLLMSNAMVWAIYNIRLALTLSCDGEKKNVSFWCQFVDTQFGGTRPVLFFENLKFSIFLLKKNSFQLRPYPSQSSTEGNAIHVYRRKNAFAISISLGQIKSKLYSIFECLIALKTIIQAVNLKCQIKANKEQMG